MAAARLFGIIIRQLERFHLKRSQLVNSIALIDVKMARSRLRTPALRLQEVLFKTTSAATNGAPGEPALAAQATQDPQ
jgi:hypothetical protein